MKQVSFSKTFKGEVKMLGIVNGITKVGDSRLQISPPIWPGRALVVQPGDFSMFVPRGTDDYGATYGHRKLETSNPFTGEPLHKTGGPIYLDKNITNADFEALMRIMKVQPAYVKPRKDFAVFSAKSEQPIKDGWSVQMRIISRFGLFHEFGVLNKAEYKKFPEQELTTLEAFWSFVEQEKLRWLTEPWQENEKDLNYDESMREKLSFGFMVENAHYRIFRIWSHIGLVKKEHF